MTLSELRKMIAANEVGEVVLFTQPEKIDCEVWVYGWPDDRVVKTFGNRLMTERTGKPKTYTSFDRAYIALREMGYKRKIVLDTALFGNDDESFDRSNP